MVSMSASVNLPLHHKVQKLSSGTDSPGWSRKKGRKKFVVWYYHSGTVTLFSAEQISMCDCVELCLGAAEVRGRKTVKAWSETKK